MQYGKLGPSRYGNLCVLGGIVLGALGCDGTASRGLGGGGAKDGGAREAGSNPDRDSGPRTSDRPEPVISQLLTKLPLKGSVTLLGSDGNSGCTTEIPAPGDRWCAFARAGGLGRTELWVVNITAAVAGTPIQCEGADPNCLRLSGNLWTGKPEAGPRHPTAHAFTGDTLTFHADATSKSNDLYEGPIYAWRPGWAEARRISSPKGFICYAEARGQVATCIDDIQADVTKPFEFDLLAGPLPAAPDQQLPRMDRIHPVNKEDISKWRADFSRDGSQFCYSTGRTDTDSENLWCFQTADLAANAVAAGIRTSPPLLTDTARWQFSRDGQKLYFLRGFNYSSEGDLAGSLVMVDYPSGMNPVPISDLVGRFFLLSDGTDADKGLGIYMDFVQGRASLRFIRDRASPTNSVLIAEGVLDDSAVVSPDLRYTFFSREVSDVTGLSDAYVARNNEATVEIPAGLCALQTKQTTAMFGSPFLKSAGLVFWMDDVDPDLLLGKGMMANPGNCKQKKQFATKLDYWFIANDDGIVFSDGTDLHETNSEWDTVTLRYAQVSDGTTWPVGGAVKIQGQVSRIYSLAVPNYDLAVLQINQGHASDGIYFVKLPPPPNMIDGGMGDAGASDAAN